MSDDLTLNEKQVADAFKAIEGGQTINPGIVRHLVRTLRATVVGYIQAIALADQAAQNAADEIERLIALVTELQAANTREVERRRAAESGVINRGPRLPFDDVVPEDMDDPRIKAAAKALEEIWLEHASAIAKYPPFNSAHEAWAVLFEEVDELWDEVKMKDASRVRMRLEARQVGAMALWLMTEIGVDQVVPDVEAAS